MRSIGGVPSAALALVALLPLACTGEAEPDAGAVSSDGGEMQARLEQFAPVTLGFDESLLDADQRRVVKELVQASRHLDAIFRLQAWSGNADAEALLPTGDDAESAATREYYRIMYGPWDRLTGEEAFIEGAGHKPHGAGFYPDDMTRDEFEEWVAANPDDEEAFRSEYTIIERDDEGRLVAVPYREAYGDYLQIASDHLLAAAERVQGRVPTLARHDVGRLADGFQESFGTPHDRTASTRIGVAGSVRGNHDARMLPQARRRIRFEFAGSVQQASDRWRRECSKQGKSSRCAISPPARRRLRRRRAGGVGVFGVRVWF